MHNLDVFDFYSLAHACGDEVDRRRVREPDLEIGFPTVFKRGSVQPECILGGLRFQSTAIRFFEFVWYF